MVKCDYKKLNIKNMKTQEKLSLLWIFVMFNYLYCDYLGLLEPGIIKQFSEGNIEGMEITAGFLLGASILMEIPIAMIILSRFLKYKLNRWLNIIAGLIMILAQCGSLFVGKPSINYTFFSVIEVTTLLSIIYIAWRWVNVSKEK